LENLRFVAGGMALLQLFNAPLKYVSFDKSLEMDAKGPVNPN
jgi:hypothetical protein